MARPFRGSVQPGLAGKADNGFTILEMMLVLLIVSLLAMTGVTSRGISLDLFMKELESRVLEEQIKAYALGSSRELAITSGSLVTPEGEHRFPSQIACSVFQWHYTPSGTISRGGTVTCTDGNRTEKLVFRLGVGRVSRQ